MALYDSSGDRLSPHQICGYQRHTAYTQGTHRTKCGISLVTEVFEPQFRMGPRRQTRHFLCGKMLLLEEERKMVSGGHITLGLTTKRDMVQFKFCLICPLPIGYSLDVVSKICVLKTISNARNLLRGN